MSSTIASVGGVHHLAEHRPRSRYPVPERKGIGGEIWPWLPTCKRPAGCMLTFSPKESFHIIKNKVKVGISGRMIPKSNKKKI